jgi:hypothetical protein
MTTPHTITVDNSPRREFFALFSDVKSYKDKKGNLDYLNRIVCRAYNLRQNDEFHGWLHDNIRPNWPNKFPPTYQTKLITCIAFVGRLRLAYLTFIHAARCVISLQKTAFRLIKPVQSKKLGGESIWVYAETQMLCYLLQNDHPTSHVHYLGISKKTRSLRGHLRALGLFATRGNHGQMESKWTLPEQWAVLGRLDLLHFGAALNGLKDALGEEVEKSARNPREGHLGINHSLQRQSPQTSRLSTLERRRVEDLRLRIFETDLEFRYRRFITTG